MHPRDDGVGRQQTASGRDVAHDRGIVADPISPACGCAEPVDAYGRGRSASTMASSPDGAAHGRSRSLGEATGHAYHWRPPHRGVEQFRSHCPSAPATEEESNPHAPHRATRS